MLQLLLVAKDTSGTLDQHYACLERELMKSVQVTIWRKEGTIREIVRRTGVTPDYILILNDTGTSLTPLIKDLHTVNIPKGLIINDIHRFTKEREQYILRNGFNHLFSVVKHPFRRIYPQFTGQWRWLPHFVDTEIFTDYGQKKEIDFLMMGAVNNIYPLRLAIAEAFRGDRRFIRHTHPGYSGIQEGALIGPAYAKELNRSKIFFTCPSVYEYPVLKYFEALAANTLLLAPAFPELLELGFIPGKHFVDIDSKNVKEKAEYYLLHSRERETIAQQGYTFIRSSHTVKIRARELLETIRLATIQ